MPHTHTSTYLLEALLHDVRTELLHRQLRDVADRLHDDTRALVLGARVEDVLDDVVAIRISDEVARVLLDLGDELVIEQKELVVEERVAGKCVYNTINDENAA